MANTAYTPTRKDFNDMIDNLNNIGTEASKDAIARLEVAREYFTNPNFRKQLEDFTWTEANQ